ncbi:aidA [Scenedesmus sp. PABB004]|nr:aidA [Scenedesmus sp. PABB004]
MAAPYVRSTLYFDVAGTRCEGWLFEPARAGTAHGGSRPPVVVMAHGMGAQKDMGLEPYAAGFTSGGLAAFVFDYRTFGGSAGEPRQWVSPRRHVEDWRAAVAFVRDRLADRVDVERLCLWGTSFAGGHVLAIAADTPGVVAVVSQVPHLDARAATLLSVRKRGVPRSLLALAAGAADAAAGALGLPPLYLPLVGPPGSLAFMQLSEFESAEYYSKHPRVYQGGWTNRARACLALELFVHRYSPIACVPRVAAPVLFVAASRDTLCPVDAVRRAAGLARRGQLLERDCTHFELYRGELFEKLIDEQVLFLRRHTGLAAAREAAAPARGGKGAAGAAARARGADAGDLPGSPGSPGSAFSVADTAASRERDQA